MDEKEKTFYELVGEMRDAQRLYFRERTRSALERAKKLERSVDVAIAAHRAKTIQESYKSTQATLFEMGGVHHEEPE